MYVCLCEGVSDRRVRGEIRKGHHTVRAIGAACGAGTGCGICCRDIRRLIREDTGREEPDSAALAAK